MTSSSLLPGTAQLTTGGKSLIVREFNSVTVQTTQGTDSALMLGSPAGDSRFVAGPSGANFAGAGFNYTAAGFKTVSAARKSLKGRVRLPLPRRSIVAFAAKTRARQDVGAALSSKAKLTL
jgi:hypothetical protein